MIGQLRRRSSALVAALAAFIIVILVAAPQAQQAPAFSPGANSGVPPAAGADLAAPTDVDLLVGRSTVLNIGSPIARVSLTVPDIADALVTAPGQLLIHGKAPGTISLFVWDKAGAIKTYEVNVRRDLSSLVEQMKQLFPGEPIVVTGSGKDVVLSGTVSSKYVTDKAADVASGYVEKKENVVNLLKQQEGVASNQVMLRVRFAEVSRSALQELGASFFVNGHGGDNWFGRSTTQQFPSPAWDQDGKLVFSDFLNLFVFNSKEGLGGVVKALQTKGLFQSLAEPNLIATNGKEASFLAGGEYPYPVVQPGGSGTSISIQFKEFGVRLNFTPTVLGGDLINLKVRPEVSSLDFSNALTVSGFRVPALSTRRTETEVELQDGQTFAIAGLLNNTVNSTLSKIPGIGDVPILGLLFQSKAHQKNQTELVVMITPTIVRRGSRGVSEGLPSPVTPYMERPDKTLPNPEPYTGSPRYPADRPAAGKNDAPAPAPAPAAKAEKPASKPVAEKAPVKSEKAPKPAKAEANKPKTTSSAPVPSTPLGAAPGPVSLAPSTSAPAASPLSASPAPAATPLTPASPVTGNAGSPYDPPALGQPPAASPAAAPAPAQPTKDQAKQIEKAREQEKKAAEAEARERAAAQKKADADKRQAEKVAKEQAARQAEAAKKSGDQKHDKALADAAARLKQAQTAYEEELQKAKGGSEDPTKVAQSKSAAPSSRQ
jgi:pilus assembly protein CpaC